jgi:hypothetical protein
MKGKFNWINITHAKKLAKIMNAKFLDEKFIDINYKHKWKCEKGHIFEMRYSNMYFRGNFCGECKKNIPVEDLDYQNKNNWYNKNKIKIQKGMKIKKNKKKEKINKHLEIVKLLKKYNVDIKYAPKSPTKISGKWLIIGNGIPDSRIFEFVHKNTVLSNPKKIKKEIDEILS